MPWFAAAIPYIAAGVAAYGAIQQGQAASAAATFNAKVDSQNAATAEREAIDLATQQSRHNFQLRGAIIAQEGASGGTGAGSVIDVIGDAASQGELQRQNLIYQGKLKAAGYTSQRNLSEGVASTARTAGYMNAAGDLLATGGNNFFNKNPDRSSSAYNSDFTLKRT